jgi:ABC-type uncharacterized transport system ATPase subunit
MLRSFDIDSGEVLGLIGRNDAGHTVVIETRRVRESIMLTRRPAPWHVTQ